MVKDKFSCEKSSFGAKFRKPNNLGKVLSCNITDSGDVMVVLSERVDADHKEISSPVSYPVRVSNADAYRLFFSHAMKKLCNDVVW